MVDVVQERIAGLEMSHLLDRMANMLHGQGLDVEHAARLGVEEEVAPSVRGAVCLVRVEGVRLPVHPVTEADRAARAIGTAKRN